jgi:hypothetical protein
MALGQDMIINFTWPGIVSALIKRDRMLKLGFNDRMRAANSLRQ